MKNILAYVNELLDKKSMDLDEFKSLLLKEYNNSQLVDIIIKKGLIEKNLDISNNTINLVNKFDYEEDKSEVSLCFSIPPFEKVALETILKTKRIGFMTIEDCFKFLIRSAKKIIKISSPFFEMSGWKKIEREMIAYLKSGGKLEVLVRGKEMQAEEETLGSKRRSADIRRILSNLEKLGLANQVKFREYHYGDKRIRSSTHAKLFISDGSSAYIGSGEVRKNSFDINFEMGVLIKGDLVTDIDKVFDFMVESSNELK
ncbi:MAG: phospholipase D family protein [Candidatus Woesearchaeota archaeon]